MKKTLTAFIIAAIFAACKSSPKTNEEANMVLGMTDTSGLYKDQQKTIQTQAVNDRIDYVENILKDPNRIKLGEKEDVVKIPVPAPVKKEASVKSIKVSKPGQSNKHAGESATSAKSSSSTADESMSAGHNYPDERESTASGKSPASTSSNNNRPVDSAYHEERENTASTPTVPEQTREKGWSHAAKGAVIGGGSGAILGAMISKKHGKGAVIGGILGAGTGYIFGREKDKKESGKK